MKVLIFGTFDHLHPGHRYVFARACARGEVWIIVARDLNVLSMKGHRPDQNEDERREAVRQACPQAHVVLGDPQDYLGPVREIAPDLILLGYDQRLPSGITEEDIPCTIERLPSFEPKRYKSSLNRQRTVG